MSRLKLLIAAFAVVVPLAVVERASSAPHGADEPPYDCETGSGYVTFEADSSLTDQVCPAHTNNYTPGGMKADGPLYIVIHNTGNPGADLIQGNIRTFQDPNAGRSAHYVIGLDKNGIARVIQAVSEANASGHAGVANRPLNGVTINNSNSIGIEVVGTGDLKGWPSDAVYRKTADLVLDIVRRARDSGRTIELVRNYIVGHEEINRDGKFDPGQQWNWQIFMEEYLGGTYDPAMALTATLDAGNRKVTLKVVARANGRDSFRIERRRNSGEYTAILSPIPDKSSEHNDNPATIDLGSDTLPASVVPARYCYRARVAKQNTLYINPSTETCVELGLADADVIGQTEDLVVGPSAPIAFTVVLKNVGDLP